MGAPSYHMARRVTGLAALAAGLAALACKSTEPLTACKAGLGVAVSASSGKPPQFGWSPGCLAFKLEVEDSTAATLWSVQAGDTLNVIAPGVTYGVMPSGATVQNVAPVPLQSGHQYVVGVFRYAGPPPDSAELIGASSFRQP